MASLETLREACQKGGKTTGKMRTDAADLVRHFQDEGLVETEEDMCDMLALFLSLKHRSLWYGSVEGGKTAGKMRTVAADLVRHFQDEGLVETEEEICDMLALFLSPNHRSLWDGSVKTGKMRTDATNRAKVPEV